MSLCCELKIRKYGIQHRLQWGVGRSEKHTLSSTEPLAELKEGPMAEPTAPGRTAGYARKAKFGEKNRPVCKIRKEQKQN